MYEDILKRHRPRGWRVIHGSKRTKIALEAKADDEKGKPRPVTGVSTALSDPVKKVIFAPYVVCEYTLHIVLHEFAHVKMEHWGRGESFLHKEEFEADRWAKEIMRLEGVKVTKAISRGCKRYLKHCLDKDEAAGVPIHTHIKRKV